MDFPSQTLDLGLYHSLQKDDPSATIKERYNIKKPDSIIGNSLLSLSGLPTPEKSQFVEKVFEKLLDSGNQSVLCWNEPVSIVSKLVELARNGKKKSKVLSGAVKLETVMKSFTMTEEGSAMSRLVEYQYSSTGRMVGLKFIDYAFQKHLVAACVKGGKTFSVFFELIHGLDAETKGQLQLTDIGSFCYLSGSAPLQRQSTLSRRLTLGRSKSITKSTVTVDPQTLQRDSTAFQVLMEHMKSLGMGKRTQLQIWTILAAILHLGNLVFVDDETKPNDACMIRNPEVLNVVCQLLNVNHERLQNTLVYKSKRVGKDTFSSCLKAKEAEAQRDTLAACLYGLLMHWIVEHINQRLSKPENEFNRVLAVGHFPWLAQQGDTKLLETLYGNYVNEKMIHFMHGDWFDELQILLEKDGFNVSMPDYNDNQIVIDLFDGTSKQSGLFEVLDRGLNLDIQNESTLGKEIAVLLDDQLKTNPSFVNSNQCQRISDTHGNLKPLFGIKHFNQMVIDYDLDMFVDEDCALGDFVSLFKSDEETFVSNLFSKANGLRIGKGDGNATVDIMRRPSVKGKTDSKKSLVSQHFIKCKDTVAELIDTISKSQVWHIIHIDPISSGQYDTSKVDALLRKWSIRELITWKAKLDVDKHGITYDEFIHKYGGLITIANAARGAMTSKDQVVQFIKNQWWNNRDCAFGNSKVWLGTAKWEWLQGEVKRLDGTMEDERRLSVLTDNTRPSSSGGIAHVASWDEDNSDAESVQESEFQFESKAKRSKLGDPEIGKPEVASPVPGKREIVEKEEELTCSRKCWTCCTWGLTWWIPSFCLSWCGGMKRPDIRMAWREKVALCLIIFVLCGSLMFFIVGLRFVICPPINVLTESEIFDLRFPRIGTRPLQPWFSVYGRYIDATVVMDSHKKSYGKGSGPGAIDDYLFEDFYGQDVSRLFYRQDAWEFYCPGIPRPPGDWDNMDPNLSWQNRRGVLEQFRSVHRNTFNGVPQLYVDNLLQYTKGRVGWSLQTIKALSSDTKIYIILFNNVYYTSMMSIIDVFPREIHDLFSANNQGKDITAQWKEARQRNPAVYDNALRCINNMFYIGTVDNRDTLQCRFTNAILFGASIVLVAVIGVKFLAALQFGTKKEPEQADKFCILMVPCYTEGAESLTKTLDSLATFRYDDKRKLLMVICDGMIIGSGNDRPTPRIVLDILGVDASQDPEPLACQALGEGSKQYNMGKVYSGLYEIRGHSVPFIVVVKCGAPSERVKPGNRGKRDSQLILMRFLNRVHFNAEFSPLELEMYHQMKNIIGVSPSFYEYILMVDADTEVEPTSLNRMISVMVNDAKVMGLCGETKVANEKESWVTMIQVYEYFISHHLAKAFESLFGTVTCLPGCFSMYRIRTPNKNIPVLVAPGVLEDYSENTVDTLHKKNLLHLGEDRYLTTLLLKHFPTMRTKFTGEARCYTVAPDRWNVLLSQRRRWINSTVHNLLELCLLDQLCGFCCFSMRFVVMLDLFATFVQPATVLYIGYLIFAVATSREQFPLLSLIMIGAIYGFQVIIFIVKREWQHIAWMFIYLAATPIISFYIPCYAFWHFDDFSWGNTRVVVGEGKKTVYVADTEPFDPKSIPLKRWRDFEENDLWEADSVVSGSTYSRSKVNTSEYSLNTKRSDYSLRSYDNQPLRQNHLSMISFGSEGVPGPFPAQNNVVSDEVLFNEIQQILIGADLMTLTKKQIRDQLSVKLGVDLRPKKDVMNRMIDEILSRQ